MSGFITSSGLDLDSIFQLKPPAITDPSGILIGQLILDGIVTDPLGLLVVPATGFKIKKTVPIVTIVDLADHYKKKGVNTYALNTGFRINNMDLSNVFEWGGYTPSIVTPIITVTGRTASITVSGNYYAVDISSNKYYGSGIGGNSGQVSHNPYTFSCLTEGFGENVTFYVFIYNGFFGNEQFSTYDNTVTLGPPQIDTVTLVSATDSNLIFTFTGQRYTKIKYFIATGDVHVFTTISYLYPSSTIDIPITSNVASLDISFIPYNEFEENGPSTDKKITFMTTEVINNTPDTTILVDTPKYVYSADFLVIGAGGSGGSGGSKGRSRDGTGGQGGGGGSGGFNAPPRIHFVGTNIIRGVAYTCGKGGAKALGVVAGSNGNIGSDGSQSSINCPFQFNIVATPGALGNGGASGGSDGSPGMGGTPNGSNGIGLTGGTLPLTVPPYSRLGNGSDGGGGAGLGGTGATLDGSDGFTRAIFYHVVMT